jgi:hypothetical protein
MLFGAVLINVALLVIAYYAIRVAMQKGHESHSFRVMLILMAVAIIGIVFFSTGFFSNLNSMANKGKVPLPLLQ